MEIATVYFLPIKLKWFCFCESFNLTAFLRLESHINVADEALPHHGPPAVHTFYSSSLQMEDNE